MGPVTSNRFQRTMQHIASLRPVAAVFRHTFHHLDRWGLGPLRGRTLSGVLAGVPNIMLTTTGARSGRSRTVPLIGLPVAGGGTAIVGTRWGSMHNPGWFHNLTSDPRAVIQRGDDRIEVVAATFTDALDEEMGRCILALYRSAAQPAMQEWGRDADAARARPGLVLSPSEDPFTGGSELARRMAERMGARFEELDGLGHWWMLHDPARGARLLEEFWAAAS